MTMRGRNLNPRMVRCWSPCRAHLSPCAQWFWKHSDGSGSWTTPRTSVTTDMPPRKCLRQLSEARRVLRDRLQGLFGVRGSHVRSELDWYRNGRALKIASSRELLSTLSTVCDEVYCDAPRVRNELVNRR